MTSFREIADLSDAYDEETKRIGDSRKEMWAEARANYSPREVAALKDAIRLRRRRRKEGGQVVDAHDDLVTAILSEITPTIGYARAPSDAPRYDPGEVIEPPGDPLPPHDPSTGEIIEVPANGPVTATAPVADGEPVTGDAGETTGEAARNKFGASPTIINPASPPCEAETAGEGGPGLIQPIITSSADPGDIPAFLRRGDPACVVAA